MHLIPSGQHSQSFFITEASHIAGARRAAADLARLTGFSETDTGKAALMVTEAATNLIKHAGRGEIVLRVVERGHAAGLEMIALDRGPGIADVGHCLRDGYSTTGSFGTGLGAIARLAAEFDVYSQRGKGTALLARLWPQQETKRASAYGSAERSIDLGAVCLSMPGESVCGDSWAFESLPDCCLSLVADGLGHGPEAAKAAQAAIRVLDELPTHAPAALISRAHGALRGTRGAALAVAELNFTDQTLRYAGVGNIAGVVIQEGHSQHMVSYNGIVGHELRKVQELTYHWPLGALMIMHSDGLSMHWDLSAYPGLVTRSASLIAGVLYRDFTRGRDDATVVVIKRPSVMAKGH